MMNIEDSIPLNRMASNKDTCISNMLAEIEPLTYHRRGHWFKSGTAHHVYSFKVFTKVHKNHA